MASIESITIFAENLNTINFSLPSRSVESKILAALKRIENKLDIIINEPFQTAIDNFSLAQQYQKNSCEYICQITLAQQNFIRASNLLTISR